MQFQFAGSLAVADGRYLVREDASESEGQQSVLVIETLSAPAAGSRKRQRAAAAEESAQLPLSRATAVRAFQSFESEEEARRWLEEAAGEEAAETSVSAAIRLLNRALHAQAVASGDPYLAELDPRRAVAIRIGYGSGEEVADGRFTLAYDVDLTARRGARRRQRAEDLRPQERVAAVLRARERPAACETMLLRARADLNAGRGREAALQLRAGLEALLIELAEALADPGHGEDLGELKARRPQAAAAAETALAGELDPEQEAAVAELIAVCERVLRRRRVLHG